MVRESDLGADLAAPIKIQEKSAPIVMAAQADIQRFYCRIIFTTLIEFSPGPDVEGGVVTDEETFFDRAKAHTHNNPALGLLLGWISEFICAAVVRRFIPQSPQP
jgi:hypothetical protein